MRHICLHRSPSPCHRPGNLADPRGRAPFVSISILWVNSLVGTVAVGINCLQWIREYIPDSRKMQMVVAIAVRRVDYTRLTPKDGNKVPFVISIVPIQFLPSIHGLLLFLYYKRKVRGHQCPYKYTEARPLSAWDASRISNRRSGPKEC